MKLTPFWYFLIILATLIISVLFLKDFSVTDHSIETFVEGHEEQVGTFGNTPITSAQIVNTSTNKTHKVKKAPEIGRAHV